MTTFENLDRNQRVRASIQRDVQAICVEACHCLGLEMSQAALDIVADLFFHKMGCYADDLEKFAKHAKRTIIQSDDCRLLTRRNPTLTTHINSLKLPGGSTSKETNKRRRTVPNIASTSSAIASPPKKLSLETEAIDNKDVDVSIDLTID